MTPQNHTPENSADDELGAVNFAFVAGEEFGDGINVADLGISFENGAPDIDTGRRSFSTSINELNSSLTEYLSELIKREAKLPELLASTGTDPVVLAASDRVHEALFALRTAHLGYTGRPFLESPLTRQHPADDETQEYADDVQSWMEDDLEEDDSYGPIERELGVAVPLNVELHSDAGTMIQAAAARVYSNGITLLIESLQFLGPLEDPATWQIRKQVIPECELIVDDPVTRRMHISTLKGIEVRDFNDVGRSSIQFWIPGALEARALSCVLKIENLPTIQAKISPMSLAFKLDPEEFRRAATEIRRP